jgi:hypothetical protein
MYRAELHLLATQAVLEYCGGEDRKMVRYLSDYSARVKGGLKQATSRLYGDILYSYTSENVGPVVPGDVMEGHVDGLFDIRWKVV